LQSLGTRVIDVMTAIPQRRNGMTSDTATTQGATVAQAEEAKAKKKASAGARRALELLKRPEGVTAKELMKATGWQPHSVRGFLSGTIGKKMGLAVISAKGEDGERTYSVKS
jgi:Protein of unknown function (DUF3489)